MYFPPPMPPRSSLLPYSPNFMILSSFSLKNKIAEPKININK